MEQLTTSGIITEWFPAEAWNNGICSFSRKTLNEFIEAVQDNQKKKLPSRYKHGDEVKHILIDASKVHKTEVLKVHFTESTVTYDIELECYWNDEQTPKPGVEKEQEYYHTRMYNAPSSFLIPIE